jgi:tight adherence protein B
LALVGTAGTLTAWTVGNPAVAWWERYLDKWGRWMQLELDAMHRPVGIHQCRQVLTASVGTLFVLGFLVNYSLVFAFLAGGLGLLAPRWFIAYFRQRRFNQINDQLVDALTLIGNALRSGLSLPQAMELLVKDMRPPISEEFSVVLKETKLGALLDEALGHLADRVPLADLKMVVTAIRTLRETGGNITEAFDSIAKTIAERKKVEGKIKVLTAQGMTQGVLTCAIPPVLAVGFFLLDPNLMAPLFTTVLGVMMLAIAAALEAMGIWMMLNIVRIDV